MLVLRYSKDRLFAGTRCLFSWSGPGKFRLRRARGIALSIDREGGLSCRTSPLFTELQTNQPLTC